MTGRWKAGDREHQGETAAALLVDVGDLEPGAAVMFAVVYASEQSLSLEGLLVAAHALSC